MNVVFLTLVKILEFDQPSIYTDLLKEFSDRGHHVYIVAPVEKRDGIGSRTRTQGNTTLVQVEIGNYFNVGRIEKGLSLLGIESAYLKGIKRLPDRVKFDLVLYSTPPITFGRVIKYIKQRDGAKSYLMLKDIFPQNAVDIGMMSDTGIIYRYFRNKEKQLYRYSDFIGCMSEANEKYLLDHNRDVDRKKVEICPNCVSVARGVREKDPGLHRADFGIPENDTVFLYGGNLGAPQGIDFIIQCLEENERTHSGYIVIIGQGSHYGVLDQWFHQANPRYCRLMKHLPREQYNKLVDLCDVGLVYLDHRFTIPNFPSRILSYMSGRLPILAATDPNTDVGVKIEQGEFGYWCESNDPKRFTELMRKLSDAQTREKMGRNGYAYLLEHYTSETAYRIIERHFAEQ